MICEVNFPDYKYNGQIFNKKTKTGLCSEQQYYCKYFVNITLVLGVLVPLGDDCTVAAFAAI